MLRLLAIVLRLMATTLKLNVTAEVLLLFFAENAKPVAVVFRFLAEMLKLKAEVLEIKAKMLKRKAAQSLAPPATMPPALRYPSNLCVLYAMPSTVLPSTRESVPRPGAVSTG
eukprot:2337782-Rhodomonas_salina.8